MQLSKPDTSIGVGAGCPLSPDAIVQRVDSSLTIERLASSVCNEEMLEGVIERIEGLGNQMIVRLAVNALKAREQVVNDVS